MQLYTRQKNLLIAGSLLLSVLLLPGQAHAGEDTGQSLDSEIQTLKQDVLALNRELFILEEELLYPSSTQVAVFLSMDTGEYFSLDSVQLRINDKVVSNYL